MLSLDTLNAPQRQAVLHGRGPLVVFAGAGSGKTRVITYRVAHLVAGGVAPWRILAVTFTNKAAGEMRERLGHILPGGARDLWVGTFHATCARVLRKWADGIGIHKDFTIYDDQDQRAMVTRVIRDLGLDDRRYVPKKVQGAINTAKQEATPPDRYKVEDPHSEIVQRVYEAYEKRMAQANAMDFGDLIYRLVIAMESDAGLRADIAGRFEHILVDEFQDTNHVQSRLVKILAAEHRNVCVVGDDDQSIYRWRGADRRNILDFRKDFPDAEVIKLEQNYRSTQRILRVAHAVISRNIDREPKQLWTENEEGPKVIAVRCDDERDEARLVVRAIDELRKEGRRLTDVAVFYRTHAQSRVFEEALRSHNTAYRVVGGMRFYDRAEVKDILAYLRVLGNPADDVSMLRIINTPARGIGKTSIEKVLDVAAAKGVSVWDVLAAPEETGVGSAALGKLRGFRKLMEGFQAKLATDAHLSDVTRDILDGTGYMQMLRDEDTPEADARLENLEELAGSISEFEEEAELPTLSAFLELVTLQTSADEGDVEDRLTLMTVHAAKGLEFPVVIVAGLEEQMFPMSRGEMFEDPDEMEEERRLAYVAFTRARERLVLSWAAVRRIFGQLRVNQPSRFLAEISSDDVEHVGGSASAPPARPSWRPDSGMGAVNAAVQRASTSVNAKYDRDAAAYETKTYVDYTEGSHLAEAGLSRGMRVRHIKFGVGRVLDVSDGMPPRVSVDFPGWGTKQIVSTFLEPA